MNGTRTTSGRLARSARSARSARLTCTCRARRLGYRVRAVSWTALCALCALCTLLDPAAHAATVAGPATVVDD